MTQLQVTHVHNNYVIPKSDTHLPHEHYTDILPECFTLTCSCVKTIWKSKILPRHHPHVITAHRSVAELLKLSAPRWSVISLIDRPHPHLHLPPPCPRLSIEMERRLTDMTCQ